MKDTAKDKSTREYTNSIGKSIYGIGPVEAVSRNICIRCKKPITPELLTQRYFSTAFCSRCLTYHELL